MSNQRTLILDHRQIQQKVTRIAHHIYENTFTESELVLVGIEPRGSILSERLVHILRDITDMDITSFTIQINKDEPLAHPFETELQTADAKGKVVLLVDDVLNTGAVLMHAASHLMGMEVKRLLTVTLVDRKHRNYPIRADYVGLTLATTLQEHIAVEFGEEDQAWLD